MKLSQLIQGHAQFKEHKFPKLQKEFGHLVKQGQHPKIMFIGCCDSRVTPDLMLSTKPGDMFILRNVGNFVSPYVYDEELHGTSAAIAYAVAVLKVKHIIVCGHSHCGACESLYKDIPDNESLIHIKTWLNLGLKAKEKTLKENKFTTKEEMYKITEKYSVISQMENLLTYPDIQKRLKIHAIKIHAWYYEIETGNMSFYDKQDDTFKAVNEYII